MSLLVCLLLAVVTNAQQNGATDEPKTTPWATLNADILGFLTAYLPEDYYVSENIYAWNITEMITIIEGNSPGLICSAPIELFSAFPTEVLKQLPLWAKHCHEMWCFANESEWQAAYGLTYDDLGVKCNGTLALAAGCPYPLVATNAWSEFGPCGVACEYSGLLHGYTQSMMDALRLTNWLVFALSAVILSVLLFNQWMDTKEKRKREPFFERRFLYQNTVMLTVCFMMIVLAMILPQIVGTDRVLCASNGNNQRIVSLGNPKAGWTLCTVFGLFFNFCYLQLVWYIAVFALSLWMSFADPFYKRMQALEKAFEKRHMNWVVDYVLDDKRMWHLAIAFVTLAFCVAAYFKNAIDAFHVMGVCIAGARGKETLMFWLDVFPALISCTVLLFCIIHGIYLLCQQRRRFAEDERAVWSHLGVRMGVFAFGMFTVYIAICAFMFDVYVHRQDIADGSKERIFCVFENGGSKNACYDVGYRLSPVHAFLIYGSEVLVCLSVLFLSFHVAAFKRWALYCPWTARLGCCEVFMGTDLAKASSLDRVTVLSLTRSRSKDTYSLRKDSCKTGTKLSSNQLTAPYTPSPHGQSFVDSSHGSISPTPRGNGTLEFPRKDTDSPRTPRCEPPPTVELHCATTIQLATLQDDN